MTKDKFNWKFCLCCGLFIWFVVNLLQGIFTEIQEDEAYYALYGEHLAWGYFDHPPMVGLMTYLSSIFFSGTLGVRFFTIIASCLSLFVMWLIANGRPFDPSMGLKDHRVGNLNNVKAEVVDSVEMPTSKNIFLFFTIACSVVMFNLYGFITTPDSALILFSTLFLLVYQHYLENKTWGNALLLGLLMALMIYSKYHAFLFLGLIVLSNLKLLKDGKFYVACILALALLLPHILWQVNNDFPSIRYHLSGRNEPFRWSYFLEYLPNQLLVFNPLTFGAVVYVVMKRNKTSLPDIDSRQRTSLSGNDMYGNLVFERGLKFIFIGFFFFFWLMTFRGHVEPHWTIVGVIPAVVLLYRKALTDERLKRYVKFVILPSILLIVVARILILTSFSDRFGYHGKQAYYQAIETVAGECPVVFQGSFQQPALYHFFTGKESSTLKSYYDRKTQYDLWQFDKTWTGQKVFICGPVIDLSKTYNIDGVEFEGYLAEHFQSANRLIADFRISYFDNEEDIVFHPGDTLHMDFSIYNSYDQPIDFDHNELNMNLRVLFPDLFIAIPCVHDDISIIQPKATHHGHLYAILGNDIVLGSHRIMLGIGNRMALFATEETTMEVRIEGK